MVVNQSANQQPLINQKTFRHDINGLRAWAVVAVVLYHFGVPGFSGGFVGVDVFFVISGFLMTGIITSGLEKGTFSLWGFYLARARRIIPALLVLCASLLILGWFWLPNADYKMLAAHVGTAVVFVSNLKFWREAGYFDTASHEKWLLHTWSLSVEWQFYILLPLVCLLLWHWFGKRGVKIALIAIGLLSLALSVYVSNRWPGAAFYLLPTRAWEMLAGGFVWWATASQPVISRRWARLAERAGFVLIIWAIVTFDSAMLWPGYLALVPVAGAMLVLAANRQHSWLTANPLARRLGASSYSIYLWHWPLVVLLTYAGEQFNPQWIALGVLGSFLFGELSLRCVENPTRKILSSCKKCKEGMVVLSPAIILVFLSCAILVLDGAKLSIRAGAISDVSKYIDQYSRDAYVTKLFEAEYKLECDFFNADTYTAKEDIPESCVIKKQEDGVFLWGDSHAQALSYGLRNNLQSHYDFYQIASSGCRPHLEADTATTGQFKLACDRSNDAAIKAITVLKPSLVIMAQRYDHDENHYEKIVPHLKSLGVKNIVIVGPVPQWQPSLPRAIAFRHLNKDEKMFYDNSFDQGVFDIDKKMKSKFSNEADVSYISVLGELCQDSICLSKVDDNNTPLVWDYGHLSLPGSDFVVKHVLYKNEIVRDYLR